MNILVGDLLKIETKEENIIGEVVSITNNYVELKSYKEEYKTYLLVNILRYVIYND